METFWQNRSDGRLLLRRRCWRWTKLPADKVRHVTPRETQESLLRAFQTAVMNGRTTQFAALLSSDIRLMTDRRQDRRRHPGP
jgi:hypothetical protein